MVICKFFPQGTCRNGGNLLNSYHTSIFILYLMRSKMNADLSIQAGIKMQIHVIHSPLGKIIKARKEG